MIDKMILNKEKKMKMRARSVNRWGVLPGVLVSMMLLSSPLYATPLAIETGDFADLFGVGGLAILPDALGGGTAGSTDISGGGISGTVGFAVWSLSSGGLVFVYDIHTHSGSVVLDEFVVDNPFGFLPIDADDPDGQLTDFPSSDLGYVSTIGTGGVGAYGAEPGTAPIGAGLTAGDFTWVFGVGTIAGMPGISALGESKRLYLVTNAPTIGVGYAELRDGVAIRGGAVPIPTPEPASLILMGSGLVGLGLWGRKRMRR